MKMTVAIISKMIVADVVTPPIRMASYPHMKAVQSHWIANQPDIAGPEIVILVSNDTDIFITIPDVIVRYHYRIHRWWGWGYNHGRWSRNDHRCETHPSTRRNDTAGSKHHCSCRD